MKIRDIERLLAANGIAKSKMDAVTRRLRESKKLPAAGRGVNAPDATTVQAAKVLIATAGSAKGVSADKRLMVLRNLKSGTGAGTRLSRRIKALLEGDAQLKNLIECRIGRNVREASFHFDDGSVETFVMKQPRDYSTRLRTEGVIPGDLMRLLADLLQRRISVPEAGRDEEPDSD